MGKQQKVNNFLDDVKKVLEEQFGIELCIKNGSLKFKKVKNNDVYNQKAKLDYSPAPECWVYDRIISSQSGDMIRYRLATYNSGSREICIIIQNGDGLWKIYADNYPREDCLYNKDTKIDVPHVTLTYIGKKKDNVDILKDDLFKAEPEEYVDMDCKENGVTGENNDEVLLAIFYLCGYPVIYVSTGGTYVNYAAPGTGIKMVHNKEELEDNAQFRPAVRERDGFDLETLESLIRGNLKEIPEFYFLCNESVFNTKIAFLVGRVKEYLEYMRFHREDYLERIDKIADDSARIEEEKVAAATRSLEGSAGNIDETISASLDVLSARKGEASVAERSKERRGAFVKTFPA